MNNRSSNTIDSAWKAVGLCFVGVFVSAPVCAQQIPAWRKPQGPTHSDSIVTVRLALKPDAVCEKNIVELDDIADLSGSEAILQAIRDLPLGPAPIAGSRQTWTQSDVLQLLKLRGIDEKIIRWGGERSCLVSRQNAKSDYISPIEFTTTKLATQSASMAERTVANVVSNYLVSKSSDAASWTVKPIVPAEHIKTLLQKRLIKGIAGGQEPWTGEQRFTLLLQTPQGDQPIEIVANVNVPSMVWGATGPLAKGHVLVESDLKLVRLTSAMKAKDVDCFSDSTEMIGKELRRAISTGQPILLADTGPPRIIHTRDLVEIHVIAGAIIAQTTGRALQSGGLDEVIEVEVEGNKKRLAARIVGGNVVEAIAR